MTDIDVLSQPVQHIVVNPAGAAINLLHQEHTIVVNSSDNSVIVKSLTQHLIVDPAISSVSVINSGPMGPAGPIGPQGSMGYVAQTFAPVDTTLFWVDTDEVVPTVAAEAITRALADTTEATARLAGDTAERAYADVLAKPGAWTQLPLQGLWANYGAPYGPAQYRKLGDRVELRGLVTSGTGVIGILPAGHRPLAHILCFSVVANDLWGEIRIDTAGNILSQVGSGWFSLSNISFSTV